ncbi:MAG: helix-turn-helix transcriptional regulator [Tissierellia bacterium]|nr:helix-turn-helix transcriptional regulator [Tissierellia bacterium]
MDDNLKYDEIGARIRKERENLNLSREKFAEILGISPYYLGQIERGDRKMSLQVLTKIAISLHLPVDYILFGACKFMDNNFPTTKYISKEASQNYNAYINEDLEELIKILSRCSYKEISLLKEVVTLIIPFIKS